MTLAQIRRFVLEVTNQKLIEQTSQIGVIAIGAQGDKKAIDKTIRSSEEGREELARKVESAHVSNKHKLKKGGVRK